MRAVAKSRVFVDVLGELNGGDSGIQNTPSWEEFCRSDFCLGSCGLVFNTKIQ